MLMKQNVRQLNTAIWRLIREASKWTTCHDVLQFLPRDALVHSAVLRLYMQHVVRLSVCL